MCPRDVWELARAQQANILAALYAGARTSLGRRAIATLDRFGAEGPGVTLPDGKSRTLLDAVWLNAVLANALEMDDFVFAAHTGVDRALDHPGRPGIYGMTDSHAVMARFNKAFGSPPAMRVRDIPRLLSLGPADTRYVVRRYARGLRGRLPFLGGVEARRAYISREQDLKRLEMNLSARVHIHLDDGRVLSDEELTAPGFAGREDKASVPWHKLELEVSSACGALAATSLRQLLEELSSPTRLVHLAPRLTGEVTEGSD